MTITLNGTTGITNTGALSVTGITTLGALGSSVITSGTAVASTSGTSIDFTGIPTWVKRITVMFYGVSLSSTAVNILIQLGVGSTPTTSGYVAVQGYIATTANTTAANSSTAGIPIQAGVATYAIYGSVVLTSLGSNIWTAAGLFSNTTTTAYTGIVSGGVTLGGVLGMVRITSNTGTDTFDLGSINILYE